MCRYFSNVGRAYRKWVKRGKNYKTFNLYLFAFGNIQTKINQIVVFVSDPLHLIFNIYPDPRDDFYINDTKIEYGCFELGSNKSLLERGESY